MENNGFQLSLLKKPHQIQLCYFDLLSNVLGVLHALLHSTKKKKSKRKVLSTFPFYTRGKWSTEVLVNLLGSERDPFCWAYSLYLVNFVGKGIVYLDCWGKKLNFNSIKKKNRLSISLRSSKQCPGCLQGLLHLIKQKSMKNVLPTFPFYRWKNWG